MISGTRTFIIFFIKKSFTASAQGVALISLSISGASKLPFILSIDLFIAISNLSAFIIDTVLDRILFVVSHSFGRSLNSQDISLSPKD